MEPLKNLIENNRTWADRIRAEDPEFFTKLSKQQSPEYLWIGCADSRVPANQIIGLMPGEVFVHRNVANMVIHTDFNCLSVIEYAVEVLKVKHIIVCGHYGCGGVKGALENVRIGLIDNWLRNIKDVIVRHKKELDAIPDDDAKLSRLCELNVLEQVRNVTEITVVEKAWREGHSLAVHGLIYGLEDGHLKDLGLSITSAEQAASL